MLKWILFDLNSYFASCEQQEDPSIRGKPVAVGGGNVDSGTIIAASYEAKKFGVKTGTKVGDAKRMCPHLIFRNGNHRLYTEYHHRIVRAVNEVLPVKKVLSIDEMACELIGRERDYQNALAIAQQMKDHVMATVGSEIKSSVGVGPNILIAKIASDMQKPDGLVIIEPEKIPEKLGPLPIESVPGIGAKMKIRMNEKGLFTIGDFIRLEEQELRKKWGSIWGLRIARELRGEDLAWRASTPQKSYSHEHVLPPALREPDKALQVILKLANKAAARLREDKVKCTGLGVKVKCLGDYVFEKSISFSDTDDGVFLIKQIQKLWSFPSGKKPFKVSIVVSGLVNGPSQMSFFDNPKSEQINQALDLINNRYGPNTLYAAVTQNVLSSGKTRIAFNHIPKASDEFED
jgi:DNA polymerase-4